MGRFVFVSFLVGIIVIKGFSQDVRINEVVSSNSNLLDEYGETPDWIELYNSTANSIDLSQWSLTDRKGDTLKWVFGNYSLPADSYLMLWASGKNLFNFGVPRTVVQQGDQMKYIIPGSEPSSLWRTAGYDDSLWETGKLGIGYGDGDDSTLVNPGTASVYIRKEFTIQDITIINSLLLDIDYDDGFVAFLNGTEIARANINGNPPSFNTFTNSDREAQMYSGGKPVRFTLENAAALLVNGSNVLAIQVHNVGTGSSDMSMIPFLTAIYTGMPNEGTTPPEILGLGTARPHVNFKLDASIGETVYLYDNNQILIDSLQTGPMRNNVSKGVSPIDQSLKYYQPTTPEAANESTEFQGFLQYPVTFSHNGGILSAPVTLTLSTDTPTDIIYYTEDGSEPDGSSNLYTGPISISANTVIRTKVFRPGYITSFSQSRSYTFATGHNLPILSLVTDPNNLFHPDSGMYVLGSDYPGGDFPYFGSNIWEDWERPANISLYLEDGQLAFSENVGIKIFGGWSRAQNQRSFSMFARGKYGSGSINYPIFPELPYDEFQALVLRNSGNDNNRLQFRDAALTGIMRGSGVDFQAYRQVVTYINGEYWGIYNIREKVNEHFAASKMNVNADSVNLLEGNAVVIEGNNQEYIDLINFISSNNLALAQNYVYVEDRINIEELIKYFVIQIFVDNTDWPGNNIKFWNAPSQKWRWILYDTDFGFGIWNPGKFVDNTLAFALEPNGPGWPNPPWSTLLFRRLVTNITFRNRFINQYADELNSRFLPSTVRNHIDTIAAKIDGEMNRHKARWGGSKSDWINDVNNMKNFASNRPEHARQHILSEFNLPTYHSVFTEMDISGAGRIIVNSLTIENQYWTGKYFETVPITLTAIPKAGYQFSHWSGDVESGEPQISVNLTQNSKIIAHFIEMTNEPKEIVINEINYNSDKDWQVEDWFELYNPNDYFIDLSGYTLNVDNSETPFIFPNGTILKNDGYLIISRDINAFHLFYPNVEPVLGGFSIPLSNEGSELVLKDPFGNIIDSVAYLPTSPWPLPANGEGPTIELITPDLDNSLGKNWESGKVGGSPGETNLLEESIFGKFNIYPNPSVGNVTIDFTLKAEGNVQISLYDLLGRKILDVANGTVEKGPHRVEFDLSYLDKGLYILSFIDETSIQSLRWVKMN